MATASPYDSEWARLSARYLAAHPVCEVAGCSRRSKHTDHIETVRSAPHRRLDPTNLQALCQAHHNIVTRAYDLGSLSGACDAEGEPLDPAHPWSDPAAPVESPGRLAARLKRAAVRGLVPTSPTGPKGGHRS